jgi:hypothetical protein
VMAAKGASGDHQRVAGNHEAGLSHGGSVRTERASSPTSDSNALPRFEWRIPPAAMADANLGEVVRLLPTWVRLLDTASRDGGRQPG